VFDYFQVNKDGRAGAVAEPLPTRLFRLRLEKLQILAGRDDAEAVAHTIGQLRAMVAALPLDNINVAPHADEIRKLADSDQPWSALDDERTRHLSATIAPLLRFAAAGGYPELQFQNQTEQLALAHLKADADELAKLRARITEHLGLLPMDLPEIKPHLAAIAATRTDAYWEHLSYARAMTLQETFAPLMRFRNRREGETFVKLSVPDAVARRHWILYGPAGEGAFAETYRARVEARVRDLAGDNPALQRLRQVGELSAEEIDAIAAALGGPDLFVTEARLREAYQRPDASLADFLRHILDVAKLPSREAKISQAFDDWVRRHPSLTATQLLFVRTLRKAVMQRAEIASLDALRKPPFSAIGDPETLFDQPELGELLDLVDAIAA
jgi:type I restriction enzyme R subunit